MRLNMLPEFTKAGIDVYLVLGQRKGELTSLIPENIKLIEVAKRGPLYFFAGLLKAIRQHRPTHILSAADDVNCMCIIANILTGRSIKVVVSNHNTLSHQISYLHGLPRLKLLFTRLLMRSLYPQAEGVVAVSEGVATDLAKQLKMNPGRITVIYNPVIDMHFDARLKQETLPIFHEDTQPIVLYAGRLTAEKRIDLLIEAFSLVLSSISARLIIAGDGPLRADITQQIHRHGLADRVQLLGFVQNILPIMAKADVLVLASDYEGLGNVIIESLACGTAVVATDCPHGPSEILENGKYGKLVPTGSAVAIGRAITETLEDRNRSDKSALRQRGLEFRASLAAKKYLSLLDKSVFEDT